MLERVDVYKYILIMESWLSPDLGTRSGSAGFVQFGDLKKDMNKNKTIRRTARVKNGLIMENNNTAVNPKTDKLNNTIEWDWP